ncbi:hypothetical protein [Phormidium sp. FACHB-1136]|uniref:hypothetical protein n=1 Tax=Phormidium sp. FACHB-1136 TaxID=2692848 RepID=UPI0016897AC5|nr:hypothetical protein [Phormidium sp. FACHB-1136]MBD2427933.1 hypothetical protein [Phormidium sp. FACHB-1136]
MPDFDGHRRDNRPCGLWTKGLRGYSGRCVAIPQAIPKAANRHQRTISQKMGQF